MLRRNNVFRAVWRNPEGFQKAKMFFPDDVLHGPGLTTALAKKASHAALPSAENSPQATSEKLTIAYLPFCNLRQC
jgi:hypothetical protein